MKTSDIVIYPEASLMEECEEVTEINSEIIDQMEGMLEFVLNHQANGIAAPQIGIQKRFFVTKFSPHFFINPVITKLGGTKKVENEGCLSIPGIFVPVSRFTKITMEFFDTMGQLQTLKLDDLTARICQHELDHLNGVLIINKI